MTNTQALSSIALTEGWTFKQADDTAENAWLSVKKVPTNVHLDLIEHGKCVQADLWRHQATHLFLARSPRSRKHASGLCPDIEVHMSSAYFATAPSNRLKHLRLYRTL